MVNDFLSKLTSRDFIPPDSLLVAYTVIAQGGAGADECLYKSSARLCAHNEPGYLVCGKGFSFSKMDPAYKLPATLCGFFHLHKNDTSNFLLTCYCLFPEVALVGTRIKCTDPVAFFLEHGPFERVRDQI